MQKHQFLREAREAALSFAMHVRESPGEEYPWALPSHYKTGDDVVWDKARGVLITGCEEDDAEIKIPVLKSE